MYIIAYFFTKLKKKRGGNLSYLYSIIISNIKNRRAKCAAVVFCGNQPLPNHFLKILSYSPLSCSFFSAASTCFLISGFFFEEAMP